MRGNFDAFDEWFLLWFHERTIMHESSVRDMSCSDSNSKSLSLFLIPRLIFHYRNYRLNSRYY